MAITITASISDPPVSDRAFGDGACACTYLAVEGTADAETLELLADGIISLVSAERPVVVDVERLTRPEVDTVGRTTVAPLVRLLRDRTGTTVETDADGAIRLTA